MIDIKTVVTTCTVLIVSLAAASTQVDRVVENISQSIYTNVTDDTYKIVKYDLLKQLEKIKDDPTDIKKLDVAKFTDFCGSYFGEKYVPSQDSLTARDLDRACSIVIARYDDGGY